MSKAQVTKATILSALFAIENAAFNRGVSQFIKAADARKVIRRHAQKLWKQYRTLVKIGATPKELRNFAKRWSFGVAIKAIKHAVTVDRVTN